MSAMQRGKKGYQSIYVPTRAGKLKQRSTGTAIPAVVRGMKRMVTRLRDEHRWVILDAIESKRVGLGEVYQYHTSNRLAALEGKLSSVNLTDHLEPWIKWVIANRQEGVRTAEVYWQQVTTLIDPKRPWPFAAEPKKHDSVAFAASELTKGRVLQWLTARDKTSSGTKRKYLYALRSFVRYLLDAGLIEHDPLAGLKAPRKNRARERWVTADVDERIVATANIKYRALFAFVKGTGCDLSSALERATLGDIYVNQWSADIHGTKTDRRSVHAATIEPWARPYIREHTRGMIGPHTRLWAGLTRSGAAHHHANCCAALGIEDYTLKDARHSVGVRMRKAGSTFEQIAAQLGTSVYQAVTVYTRYQPDAVEVAKEAQG